jgi:hypothetical protein
MLLRSALILSLLVSTTALSAPPPEAEKVQLRWKVAQDAPLAYEFATQPVTPGKKSTMRFDLSTLKKAGVPVKQRKQIFELQLPTESAMAVVLSGKPSGDVATKVVVTRVALPKKKKTKADKEMAKAVQQMVGKVQIRATMTDWGFVTTDLGREQRNLVALMLELPNKPVAVGDSWTHSADLLKMGHNWEGERESLNRVELVALEKEGETTVAIIDFTIAERQEGGFPNRRTQKEIPASMETSFVGRGEFLVEEGRWRRVAGRMTTRATGIMQADSDQQFTLTRLDPIPPQVLAAE